MADSGGGRRGVVGGRPQDLLEAPAAWVGTKLQGVIKGAQHSLEMWTNMVQPKKMNFATTERLAEPTKIRETQILSGFGVEGEAPSLMQRLESQVAAWRLNSHWVDETPELQVTVPKGTLCKFDSRFKIGIPPDAVYNILTDPDNKRVFKNIQEVKYRKVLEDDGDRQLVELEQLASWRFLWLSGTLSACVFVDQDRSTHTVKYWLAKTGFMKKFEGTWKIEPLIVDDSGQPVPGSGSGTERVASLVTLQQVWQSVIVPPPPFVGYVRGITTKTTEVMMQELQAEGKRIREGLEENSSSDSESQDVLKSEIAQPQAELWKRSAPGRRKTRKSRWRLKSD